MKYKLLVLDIDGTLVGKQPVVSKANMLALKQALGKGIIVTLCTGRAPRGARGVLGQLSIDGYHTFFDGALVINPETEHEVYVQSLDVPVLQRAIAWARDNDLDIELYSSTRYFAEHENWSTRAHVKFFDIAPVFGDHKDVVGYERIVKIGTVGLNEVDRAKIHDFERTFAGTLNFTYVHTPAYPGVDFINIVSPLVSKGEAVLHLAAHLNIKEEEIAAIGDGANDISLLAVVGLGIAMPHAPEELKAVADHLTSSVEEDGVAAAIQKFILAD